jgi:hypothetical protein
MAIEGPSVSQVGELMGELASFYAVGAVAEAANIEGGSKLKDQTAYLLAEISERTGLIDLSAPAGPAESGGFWLALAGAANWLRATGASLLTGAAAQPGFTLGLVGLVGGTYTVHQWLTMDERIQQSKARELAEVLQGAINGMSAEDRARFVASAAGGLSPGWSTGRIVLWGLGIGAGLLAWRWYTQTQR